MIWFLYNTKLVCTLPYKCDKDVWTYEKYKTISIQTVMVVIGRHMVLGEFLLYSYFYIFLLFLFHKSMEYLLNFFTCKLKFI